MITHETFRYILDQTNKHEDALNILDNMFFQKGSHVVGIEFLDSGELKVTVRIDAS